MIPSELVGIRTIIFDMDGTLLRSGDLAKQTLRVGLQAFFDRKGLACPEYTDEELTSGIGAPSDVFYRSLLPESFQPEWEEFRSLVTRIEIGLLESKRITFPGTIKVLRELKARGYEMVLVSNCSRTYMNAALRTQSIGKYFSYNACIGDGEGLTKADLMQTMLEKLGKPAVAVGDRFYDCQAAKEVGIPIVGALYGYGTREELAPTFLWVEDIRDLLYVFDPLQETAERIAGTILDSFNKYDVVMTGLDACHPAISHPLTERISTILALESVPVVHLSLSDHALLQPGGNGIRPKYLLRDVTSLEPVLKAMVGINRGEYRQEITLLGMKNGKQSTKTFRVREGTVLLIESPFQASLGFSRLQQVACFIRSTPGITKRMIQSWEKSSGINESASKELLQNWRRYLDSREWSEHSHWLIDGNRMKAGVIRKLHP